jgi:hypothetical protein
MGIEEEEMMENIIKAIELIFAFIGVYFVVKTIIKYTKAKLIKINDEMVDKEETTPAPKPIEKKKIPDIMYYRKGDVFKFWCNPPEIDNYMYFRDSFRKWTDFIDFAKGGKIKLFFSIYGTQVFGCKEKGLDLTMDRERQNRFIYLSSYTDSDSYDEFSSDYSHIYYKFHTLIREFKLTLESVLPAQDKSEETKLFFKTSEGKTLRLTEQELEQFTFLENQTLSSRKKKREDRIKKLKEERTLKQQQADILIEQKGNETISKESERFLEEMACIQDAITEIEKDDYLLMLGEEE